MILVSENDGVDAGGCTVTERNLDGTVQHCDSRFKSKLWIWVFGLDSGLNDGWTRV